MRYKGGIIEKLDNNESLDVDGKRYHVTLPKGCIDGHGGTVSYKRTIIEAKQYITNYGNRTNDK